MSAVLFIDPAVIVDTMALHRGYRLDDSSPLVTRWICTGCGEQFPLITTRAQASHELHVAQKVAAAVTAKARGCANTQCRVTSFDGDRCPACYGAPS